MDDNTRQEPIETSTFTNKDFAQKQLYSARDIRDNTIPWVLTPLGFSLVNTMPDVEVFLKEKVPFRLSNTYPEFNREFEQCLDNPFKTRFVDSEGKFSHNKAYYLDKITKDVAYEIPSNNHELNLIYKSMDIKYPPFMSGKELVNKMNPLTGLLHILAHRLFALTKWK